jgi:hypothetical protein
VGALTAAIHGTLVPVDEPSTPSNRQHHPLLNADWVQPHSRGHVLAANKSPGQIPGPGGEQVLARDRAPTVHPPAMMGGLMMVAAVVKAKQPGIAGKGLG